MKASVAISKAIQLHIVKKFCNTLQYVLQKLYERGQLLYETVKQVE